jgi:hypothetical protein
MNRDIGHAEKAVEIDVSGGDQALGLGCRAFHIGGAGDLVVEMYGGGDVTFTVTAGQILPISASTVRQTGTTATAVVALL